MYESSSLEFPLPPPTISRKCLLGFIFTLKILKDKISQRIYRSLTATHPREGGRVNSNE